MELTMNWNGLNQKAVRTIAYKVKTNPWCMSWGTTTPRCYEHFLRIGTELKVQTIKANMWKTVEGEGEGKSLDCCSQGRGFIWKHTFQFTKLLTNTAAPKVAKGESVWGGKCLSPCVWQKSCSSHLISRLRQDHFVSNTHTNSYLKVSPLEYLLVSWGNLWGLSPITCLT